MKKACALILTVTLFSLFTPLTAKMTALNSSIAISEVLANATNDDNDEFIELYNNTNEPIDISGWKFTDGDAVDEIVAWDDSLHGQINTPAQKNTTLIPQNAYAVILDQEYDEGGQPYNFPASAILFTTQNTTIGNELTTTDTITLYNEEGTLKQNMVDTFGTPIKDDNPLLCDDDGLDNIPFDPGDDISLERINPEEPDAEENWARNAENKSTPGLANNPYQNFAPTIINAAATPNPVILNGDKSVTFTAKIEDENGKDDLDSITLDLSSIGETAVSMYDDGTNGDSISNDSIFTNAITISKDLEPKVYSFEIKAQDKAGEEDAATISLTMQEPVYPSNLFINELLPNPSGDENTDEFIEIYNGNSSIVDLSEWKIKDGSTTFKISGTIGANSFLAVYKNASKISLNNSGDEVFLINPKGEHVHKSAYSETAKEDYAYAREDNGSFSWTSSLTPNKRNIFTAKEAIDDENENTNDETPLNEEEDPEENEIKSFSIKETKDQENNSLIKTSGVVTVPLDVFSDNYIFIQDENSGIKVYSSYDQLDGLKTGDEIEFNGKISETKSETKINLLKDSKVETVSTKNDILAKEINTDGIIEENHGIVVSLSGNISKQSGNTFYLKDDFGEAKASILEKTSIKKPKMKKDEQVKIVGIIDKTSSGFRILPRFQDDLKTSVNQASAGKNSQKLVEIPKAGSDIWLIIGTTLGAIVGFAGVEKLILLVKKRAMHNL